MFARNKDQNKDRFLKLMLAMAREGGDITRRLITHSQPSLKSDQSVLTKADTAVSAQIKRKLSRLLRSGAHLLVDEEDAAKGNKFDQALWERTPYMWVIDPVDGTRAFANQMPLFGISIGLLKGLRPWLGVVYFPLFDELFYCDGKYGYFVQKAFRRGQRRRRIRPLDQKITPQSLFLVSDSLFQLYDWDFDLCQVTLPSCAVIDLCWPAVGRGCGCFFNAHLWDFAGAWPIFRSAGLELRTLSDGKVLDQLHTGVFRGKGELCWRMREPYLLSSKRNFPLIRKGLRERC